MSRLALRPRERAVPLRGLRPGPPRRALRGAAAAVAVALVAVPHPARGGREHVERFTGTARGGDGAVLYLEEHAVRRTAGRLRGATTTYLDPEGRVIAILRTDFSRDPFAPSYRFEDQRSGAREGVRVSAGEVELRGPRGERTLDRSPDAERPLVTGQGLDRLVRDRLDDLARGEVIALSYAIPSRLDVYDLRVRALDAAPGAPVRIRVEFSSWILRLLAPSLEVEYDPATRRLLRYRGVSNLSDAGGEHPEVEITYAYPAAPGDSPEEPHAAN